MKGHGDIDAEAIRIACRDPEIDAAFTRFVEFGAKHGKDFCCLDCARVAFLGGYMAARVIFAREGAMQ